MKIYEGFLKVLGRHRLNVYAADSHYVYGARGYTLFRASAGDIKKFDAILQFPCTFLRRNLSRLRLLSRLLRPGIRDIFSFENFLLVIVDRKLYRVSLVDQSLLVVHTFKQGTPLRIEFSPHRREYYFGTYDTSETAEPSRIFVSRDGIDWEVRFEFDKLPIRHVHGLFSSQSQDLLVVCTGDSDDESKILVSRDGCRTFEVVAYGNQYARAVSVLFSNESKLLVASDSPDCQNYVYEISLSRRDQVLVPDRSWVPIDASCFHMCKLNSHLLVSTIPEKSSVNQTNQVSVYSGERLHQLKPVASLSRDLVLSHRFRPYFQHPSVRIIPVQQSRLFILSGTAVKGLDGYSIEVAFVQDSN